MHLDYFRGKHAHSHPCKTLSGHELTSKYQIVQSPPPFPRFSWHCWLLPFNILPKNQNFSYQFAKCHSDLQSLTFTLPCVTWILDVCPSTDTWVVMAPPTKAFLVLLPCLCRKRRLCRAVYMLWVLSLPSGSRVIKTHIISKWTDEKVLKTGLVW